MPNAVIYARYSSHNQREESIEGQLRECHDFAAKNGFTVINEYCDRAISGKTDQRPSFQKLIKDSEKGRFEAVIMYTLDRFARNRYDSAIYKAKLKKHGVRVFYAKQPMPEGPEAIILESVMEGYAEYYSENLSRNIKRGLKENAQKGLVNGGAGRALGYTMGEDGKFQIDPVGAKIVQEIFQMYADGVSATQIIKHCNEQGYKTAIGNAFGKNSLHSILKNEKYIGVYKFMDVVIPDGVPAILDKTLFEEVQTMLKHNATARAKTKAHEDYLLVTKLFCGHCGSRMVGESGKSKTGKMHYYYKCANRKRKHNCDKKMEKKDWIEELVVRYTVENVLTDENIERIAVKAMEIIEKESEDTTYLNALKDQLKEVEKKINNIMSAIEQGIITSTTKERLVAFEDEKGNLEDMIAREESKKPFLTKEHIVYWLLSFKNGDIKDKTYQRRIIDTLVNSVYIYDDGDKGRKIVLTFNMSGHNTATITCSDIKRSAPPKCANPNTVFFVKECFGFVLSIEEVG
jgi:DNA invertase Pin-like site-specific DNA recombinase